MKISDAEKMKAVDIERVKNILDNSDSFVLVAVKKNKGISIIPSVNGYHLAEIVFALKKTYDWLENEHSIFYDKKVLNFKSSNKIYEEIEYMG